ncbi:MAG TPA: hypothetical protein VKM36_01105 [Balneolaceae bacterium]|nr:hypothetical protein [Balneolaceae bacterium]
MPEEDPKSKKIKNTGKTASEYVSLEADLISRSVTGNQKETEYGSSAEKKTILILSGAAAHLDKIAAKLQSGLGRTATILTASNRGSADILLKEGNIDLILCGPNPDNPGLPFYSEEFGTGSNFTYGSSFILIKKSDPGLISWMNMHGRIGHITHAIDLLNTETS